MECTRLVPDALRLAHIHSMSELKSSCLKWITAYCHQLWKSRAMATLQQDILDDVVAAAESTIVSEEVVSL